jgi:DNA-binding transcriptional LysR family regulator
MVRLTEAGERFLADCRPLLSDLHEAEQAARGAQAEAQGLLSITAPQMFGIQHVAPIVLDFLQAQPRVQARTLFVNRVVHLLEEDMDVAVRIAHLHDSGLTALQVGSLRQLVVASPEYLVRHGEPRHPHELGEHRAIAFSFDARAPSPWRFRDGTTGTPQQAWISKAGLGLTRCLAYQAAASLRAGRLRIVLTEHEPDPVPVHIVYPAGRRAPAKVRAFVEFARHRLAAEPVLQGRGLARRSSSTRSSKR